MKYDDVNARLIRILARHKNTFVSSQDICRDLKISRAAVWKKIHEFNEVGYSISTKKNKGYKLTSHSSQISAEAILSCFADKPTHIGSSITCFDSMDSTNRFLKQAAMKGVDSGSMVFSEHQSLGRGRFGRKWESPRQMGLYFSILLRPKISLVECPKITLITAVSLANALEGEVKCNVSLKWPNDIFLNGKKIGGILVEIDADSDHIQSCVIGVGININSLAADLPVGATSLKEETSKEWNRNILASSFIKEFNRVYNCFLEGSWDYILDEWKKRSSLKKGQKIKVSISSDKKLMQYLQINNDGSLLVQSEKGEKSIIWSGDVS